MLNASESDVMAPDGAATHGPAGDGCDRPVSMASSLVSEDEFYDCKSQVNSAKPSLDAIASVLDSNTGSIAESPKESETKNTPSADRSPQQQQQQQRYRSLTNSRVPKSSSSSSPKEPDGSSAANLPPMPSTLRRSATASEKHGTAGRTRTKSSGNTNSLIEERARRAVKAMAEACTTGISVREADERRTRAFNRLLVDNRMGGAKPDRPSARSLSPGPEGLRSSSNDNMAMRSKLRQNAIHPVASHSRISSLGRKADLPVAKDSEAPGLEGVPAEGADADVSPEDGRGPSMPRAATTGPLAGESDSRALSMTNDRKAMAIARSASLEARVDKRTREGLAQWVVCFATVQFDVDQGPTLNLLYPHVPFSESERAAICFSSMPDSTIYELYDSVYTFHFRVDPVRLGLAKEQIFLYGHVFFRQKRDPLMRRGGFQRSVAVISHLPFHGLFSRMVHMLGPLYFDLGTAILEAAAHNVSSWPRPSADGAYELPFLGTALAVEVPARDASQLLETSKFPLDRFDPGEHILASVTFDGLFRSFRDALDDLWTCWELMILGESLVVLADTPSRCSEAIVGLVDIIFPITYCGDYRPYFTIQDPDFRAVVSKTHVPPNTVVGVSNPFFSEALSHWPHKLFLGTSGRMAQMHGASARKARAYGDAAAGDAAATAAGPAGGAGVKQGLQSKYRCAVAKDRVFAEHLLDALKTGKQPPWIINNTLRRYFIDLTVQFLAPLNRYFSTLIPQVPSSTAIPMHPRDHQRAAPWAASRAHDAGAKGVLQAELTWFTAPGNLRPWRTDDFMASLASLGISPQLSSRHAAASAADMLASVFSGSSNSAEASGGGGGASQQTSSVAAPPSSSSSSSVAPGSSSAGFSLWKSKKSGSKKLSDEWQQLYARFLKCGNFATWLARRTDEAQRALLARFRQEVGRGDVHAWCRGFDYPLDLGEQQLATELEMLDLATMDLGQGSGGDQGAHAHAKHVFYHGEAEDERQRAERQRQRVVRERHERLGLGAQPVYGSDGSLIGYTRRRANGEPKSDAARGAAQPQGPQRSAHGRQTQTQAQAHGQESGGGGTRKQLGQRITHARRPQHVMLAAAWQVAELMGPAAMARIPLAYRDGSAMGSQARTCPPSVGELAALRRQLSTLLEYMAAAEGRLFVALVASDYAA
ncbi:hypothetical protein H4R99_000275 [Coemansia sp. RSA 1722]|nr:hypothetical protein IWW45_000183 [Coemansia sp. RSA 485]KAJ2606641.1 hypothetical protein H4R99_000275 [Coemansia sp. RSA 1722]